MSTQVSLHGRVLALLVVLAGSALGFLVLDPGAVLYSMAGAVVLNLVIAINHRRDRYVGF